MREKATALAADLTRTADSLRHLIDDPGRDHEHACAEMIRLAAQARDAAIVAAESMSVAAHRAPASLSLRRLSTISGVSIHTLRARLADQARDTADPFVVPLRGTEVSNDA